MYFLNATLNFVFSYSRIFRPCHKLFKILMPTFTAIRSSTLTVISKYQNSFLFPTNEISQSLDI